MKLSKRTILLLLCMMTALTLSFAGTLAYLTDTAGVTNTFTVGKVQITLDEAIVTPEGIPEADPDTGDTRTDTGNDYHLVPGRTFTKDPTVTVKAESERAYIRMVVTITKYPELTAAFTARGATFKARDYAIGYDPALWVAQPEALDPEGNLVLEYRYHTTVGTMNAPDLPLEPLFTDFTVPGILDNDDMTTLLGMEIKVRGEAIQAEGFADDDAAWAAFEAAHAPASTAQP